TTEFRRRHRRRYHVSFVRYHLNTFDKKRQKKLHGTGVSVDISEGGLGLITQYPLKEGHFLLFEDGNMIDDIKLKASIVRWSQELEDKTYRAGLEFAE
ncbi:MAG: PilZ domain-containing protein, partial [Thermodesulfovibrionales bacterium]